MAAGRRPEVLTDDYRLIRYPDWALDPTFPAAQSPGRGRNGPRRRSSTRWPGGCASLRWGSSPGVAWWVSSATLPQDTEAALRAAVGGCTLRGEVAQLWGAVTLREYRRRGAYRAVLAERLRLARVHGATLALVKGRVETSGPILLRDGFAVYAEERCYWLPLT